MNRIFDDDENGGWPEFPRRSLARLDSVEPQNFLSAGEAVFSFDAIDANWFGTGLATYEAAIAPQSLQSGVAEYWKALFLRSSPPKIEPFDAMPIYNVSVTVHRGDAFWDILLGLLNEDWIEIVLSPQGAFPVEVYGSLIAPAVAAKLVSVSVAPADEAAVLSTVFDVGHWPDADKEDIRGAMAGAGAIDKLALYDVGQGSALGLLDSSDDAKMFFDLGAGCYGNSHTRPRPLRFCWRGDPVVILSHWDADHWAGGSSDRFALQATWIAPRQSPLPGRHHLFAARILRSGGSLMIWGGVPGAVLAASVSSSQSVSLSRCTGPDRNGSGIALIFDDSGCSRSWLLTGDAGYAEIPLTPTHDLSAVVVPHHGGDMSSKGSPPAKPKGIYTRLLYSYGPGNRHGKTNVRHPTAGALSDHVTQGWVHSGWTTTTVGLSAPGGDALATASNPMKGKRGGKHLDGAAIGLFKPPAVPLPTLSCSKHGNPTGCTLDIVQN